MAQREARHCPARRADKLVQLVGERNPNVEEELRIYVGKHPWKVAQLLAEAKKVFKTAVRTDNGGKQLEDAVTKETQDTETSKTAKKGKKGKHKKDKAKKKKRTRRRRRRNRSSSEDQ